MSEQDDWRKWIPKGSFHARLMDEATELTLPAANFLAREYADAIARAERAEARCSSMMAERDDAREHVADWISEADRERIIASRERAARAELERRARAAASVVRSAASRLSDCISLGEPLTWDIYDELRDGAKQLTAALDAKPEAKHDQCSQCAELERLREAVTAQCWMWRDLPAALRQAANRISERDGFANALRRTASALTAALEPRDAGAGEAKPKCEECGHPVPLPHSQAVPCAELVEVEAREFVTCGCTGEARP